MLDVFRAMTSWVSLVWQTYLSVRLFCYWLVLYVLNLFIVPAIRKLQGKE